MTGYKECGVSCDCDGPCELELGMKLNECQHENIDYLLCSLCKGCGEGQTEGSICWECDGQGTSNETYCVDCEETLDDY